MYLRYKPFYMRYNAFLLALKVNVLKSIPTIVISILLLPALYAQTLSIEESQPMSEARSGWLKLVQLKNGNTALLNITFEEGIKIWLYDKSRVLIAESVIKPAYGENGMLTRSSSIESVFAIGDEIALFVSTVVDKVYVLQRVRIDGKNGSLLKTEEIGRALENSYVSSYVVRKDPDSDYYGVGIHYVMESGKSKRIEFIHYSTNHQPLSRAFYNTPDQQFKYMWLIDFVVIGDQRLVSSVYVFNVGEKKETFISLGSLEKGSLNFKLKVLGFTAGMEFSGILRYNKNANLMALMGLDLVESKSGSRSYSCTLSLVDLNTFSMVHTQEVGVAKINESYKKIFDTKRDIRCVPEDFYINDDGTYAIVFESSYAKESTYATTVYLESMAVSFLNEKAQDAGSCLIPKSHAVFLNTVPHEDYRPLYISRRQRTAQSLRDGNNFKSFVYVSGKTGNYIFYNEVMENLEKIKKGRLTTIQGISSADAFICTTTGGNLKTDFLFGKPAEDTHNFAMYTVSDYDAATGVFATIKVENNKGKRQKIVWVKL